MKRVLRSGIKRVGTWMNSDKTILCETYPKFSYKWINHYLFPKLLQEGGQTFRPNYVWGVLQGVNLAKALDLKRISVLEFGVAGGNGLVALEKIAEKIEPIYDVEIDVYGFDTGIGLPKLIDDFRDEPHYYELGQYKMHALEVLLGFRDELAAQLVAASALAASRCHAPSPRPASAQADRRRSVADRPARRA